jgi:hypothetical protein
LEDLRNLVGGDRRKFHDWCVEHIPGYGGYTERETRREADKMLRVYIADKIAGYRREIVKIVDKLTSAGRLEEVFPVDRVIAKSEKTEDRIRFADYGYTGFFDPVRVDTDRLDKIYDFDAKMLQDALTLEDSVKNASQAASGDKDALTKALEALTDKIASLDSEFSQREEILLQP